MDAHPPPEAWLDAQCALLGLALAAEHRPGVIGYLRLAAGLAPLVMDFALDPADEPAGGFVPLAPRAGDEEAAA